MLAKQQFEEISEEKRLNPVHGNIYQLKLLMLFLYRGVSNQYSFHLATEVKEAEKFDDLVFQYFEDGKIKYRLLQAKHKLDESKKITLDDLLGRNDNNYSLVKYFFSYRNAKKSKLFQDGIIEDVIICTNIGLDLPDLKRNGIEVKNIEGLDYILDIKNSASKRYSFNRGLISKLKPILDASRKNLKYGDLISDEEIQDFLNHLVFAVNQPNEEELGKIIKNEIGEDLDLVTTENTYNKFFITMLNWLQGKERGRFLSYEEGKEFFEEAKRELPILFNVRDPVSSFTGRIKQLDNLHKAMMNGGRAIVSQSVSISGLGGVGKSELARKYISQYSKDYDNKVIWINAESYSTLSESFRRLACDKLGISLKNRDGKEKDIKSIVEDVYRFFSKGKSLFVFDNAEKYRSQSENDDGIDKFLPSLPENMNKPHILVTSRNTKWPKNVKICSLNTFTKAESVEFIKKALKMENSAQDEDVIKLAEKLQYFPLALQQAVAYIREKKKELRNVGLEFTINDYLQRYEGKTRELLNFPFPEDSNDNYTKTTLITWEVTLDSIRQKESGNYALDILNVVSYLAPENIPTEIVLSLVSNKEKLGSAIELLRQYSMINLERTILDVHRLVQKVTRMKLEEQNREEEVLTKALKLFNKNNVSSKNVDHAISVWNHSSKYTELVQEFPYLSSYICVELINSARFEEAYLFGLSVSKLLNSLPSNNPSTIVGLLTTKNNIAGALLKQGKYDEALKAFREVDNIQKTIFEENQSETLITPSNIALTLFKQGKYNEALERYQEVLDINKSMLGENHPDTLSIKHDIAGVLLSQGKHGQALQMLQEIYEIREATLGKNHSQTLNTKNSIAGALSKQCKYDKALQMLQEIYEIQEADLEKNHLDISKTKSNIAVIFLAQGKYSKALQTYKEVLDVQKDVLGESHPDVLVTYSQIVEALRGQGKHDKALEVCQKVFHKQKGILGSDHPDVFNTQYIKALIFDDQGKYSDALQVYKEVLSKREVVLGNDHPDTLKTINCIAVICSKQGEYDKALQYYKRVLKIQRSSLGENHSDTLSTRNNIGMALYSKKEYDKALQIFQEVFSTLQTLLPDHPDTLSVKNNIALVLSSQKKYDEALKIFREVLNSQEAILGKENHSITTTKNNMAAVLLEKGRHNEALRVLREVFKELSKVLGPEHPEILSLGKTIQSLSTVANDLLTAAGNNNLKKMEDLVKNGGDVNTKDDDGKTLLHYAINNRNIDIVNILLKNGADVTQITKEGNTPLHVATSDGHRKIIEVLLQHTKQLSPTKLNDFINAKTANTNEGKTALHIAAEGGNFHIIKLLLKNGAVYHAKNKDNKTPSDLTTDNSIKDLFNLVEGLFENIKRGNHQQVSQCLKKEKAIVNARDNNGGTPLYWAISKGDLDTANILLDNDADPTLVTNKGNTPLHMASNKGNTKAVKILLAHVKNKYSDKLGQFINAQTTVGETSALHIASNIEVTRSLLQYGAVYNIKNKEGQTPLDLAKNDDIRKLLSFTNELFECVKKGNRQVISKLRSLKADDFIAVTNARNDQGHTLLQVAADNKHKDIATKLLQMLKEPGQVQSKFSPECELDQLKKLKSATELHIHFSELYLPMLRSMSQPYSSEKNTCPWKTLKEGSYYLGNAYHLVEVYKDCIPGSIDNQSIQSVNDMLVALEFDPKHITSGYTDEAYGGKAQCFVSKGQGTQYYKLLHSELKKDVRLFIEMVELNIDIPVKRFLESINQRLQSTFSEKLLEAIENDNPLAVENCIKRVRRDELNDFINARTTYDGNTLLHVAAKNGFLEVVKSLLKHGATYNIENKEGKTPINLSKDQKVTNFLKLVEELFQDTKKGNVKIINKLRVVKQDEFLAVTSACNNQGNTLLQVAIANKHRDIETELSKMLKNLEKAPSSSMESVNVAGPSSRSFGRFH